PRTRRRASPFGRGGRADRRLPSAIRACRRDRRAAALREHRPWTAPPSRQSGASMSQLSRASVLALSLLLAPGLAAASPVAAANRPASEASAAAQALREQYTAEWE